RNQELLNKLGTSGKVCVFRGDESGSLFKDAINAGRLRRIVQYSSQGHYADVKISRTPLD
ncbi:unnamed protein product, partial [Aureobasidium pullulans]